MDLSSAEQPSPLMVEVRANGTNIPICFLVNAAGFANISSLHLSVRFNFVQSSLWVEREVFNPMTSMLTHTMLESSVCSDHSFCAWILLPGKYRVYGLSESQFVASIQLRTPRCSSLCTMAGPYPVKVKVEFADDDVIELSESSDGDIPTQTPVEPSHPSQCLSSPCHSSSPRRAFHTPPATQPGASECIVNCLWRLASMPGRKSVLKLLNYSTLKIVYADFLPSCFDGDVIFVFPPVSASASTSKAKAMDGMDKRYNGHVWTKTQSTNITNNLSLTFRSSNCVGHLQCQNPHCDYLHRAHRISSVNDTDFDGFTMRPFPTSGPPPMGSTLMCRICKEPPKCIAPCVAKIIYDYGDGTTQRACIHLGFHRHPVKAGDCRANRKRIDALIQEHMEKTLQVLQSKIILEASKDLLGNYLLHEETDPPRLLSLEELEPVFDSCKELNSLSLRNQVTTFKHLRRFGVMDGITKL